MGKKKETILVLSAHSDDFVLGAGGTIAQYVRQKKKVKVIIFSYGEKSHPWLKKQFSRRMRAREAYAASKILGCSTSFLDLHEFRFYDDYRQHKEEIQLLLQKENPAKIFTHSPEDPHPDHQAVHKITLELYDCLRPKPEVYTYSVWNPVSFRTLYPALYVDVSRTFAVKLKALRKFTSQRIHITYPFLLLLYRAVKDGFHIRKRFGEHFFKVR